MQQEIEPEMANDKGDDRALSQENANLSSRLEVYRWFFWAAVFLIVVLLVAQCARHG